MKALDYAAKRDLPVLGVCRGAQMLNVFYGGTLHQDIYKTYEGLPRRWTPLPARHVTIAPESLLHRVLGTEHLHVNSLHTQSVDKLGTGLKVTARDRHDVVQGDRGPLGEFSRWRAVAPGVHDHPLLAAPAVSRLRARGRC